MKSYTLEEAQEALKPFGIRISKVCRHDDDSEILWIDFYSNNGDHMEKPDGFDSAKLRPSDFNMVIDGWEEN